MKKMLQNLKLFLVDREARRREGRNIFLYALPFILMDLFIRILALKVTYVQPTMILPSIIFTAIWILLFVMVSLNLNRIAGMIIYSLCFIVFFVVFLVNSIYFPYTGFFFSFGLLSLAGEGSAYIWSTIKSTNPVIFLFVAIVLTVGIIMIIKFPKRKKSNFIVAGLAIVAFLIVHWQVPPLYGKANSGLEWDTWRNPRNVYENFNDSNKSIKICGLYEYAIRDFYMTFLKVEKENPEETTFLETVFEETIMHESNEYTGILKGKNVIFLQLEGIDSWLLDETTMPNLFELRNNSINFTDHYSYYTGGGSTFNSELAVNTGFITPISYMQNAYTFSSNLYPYSMPHLFKNLGYSVNAFHMNKGEYYSRGLNYQNWGYDHYYGLQDMQFYTDLSYELDRELILNQQFYDLMFKPEGPFAHYIITYTPHTPYNVNNGKGLYLAEELYGDDIPDMTQEDVARLYAGETDKMIGLLMEALKENGLLENTVIVAYADHYLYTLGDKTILEKYKNTENNLINNTPFFIWSYGMEPATIEKTNSQIDILPTVLNMFGIEYEEDYFIGHDIMDQNHAGYVFFSDYSWYDGNVYVDNGEVANEVEFDQEYVDEMNQHITELIQKNDYVLKYDYFRRLQN